MRRGSDVLDKIGEALSNIEEAILYAVLTKEPPVVIEGLRRTHRRAQAMYNLLEERWLSE